MKDILYRLFDHQYLGREEARQALADIAGGKYNSEQISAMITVFLMRSISVDELTGFRDALLALRVPVDLSEYKPIDIVGTGGDGKNTFNISTASCFVLAGAGYNVVKHGNYGATSVSGASNVIEQHGVKFTKDINKLRKSLDTCRIAYLHAPFFNPALKAVASIRKNLGVRTFFNLLGPLVNPVIPAYQLLGVYNLPLFRLYSYTYQVSGTRFGVVHSIDGYDEISLTSEFKIAMPEKEKVYTPEMIGMKRYKEADLYGGDTPEVAAAIFDRVLNNTATDAQRDCVLANSAFAIQVICPEKSIEECLFEAHESLQSGKALSAFKKFVEVNSSIDSIHESLFIL
jgi:anthranilate phosphoribosyltransferase